MTGQPHPTPRPYYPARARINVSALTANTQNLVARAGAHGAAVMAIVKADAYGHGLLPCALAAQAGGATWLGVAQLTEAFALRDAGVTGRIFAWLYGPGAPLEDVLSRDIDISVAGAWAVPEIILAAQATGRVARVHLKVDTGLGRNGIPLDQMDEALVPLLAAERAGTLRLVGIWSHFAFADEPEHQTVLEQAEVFDRAIAQAEAAGANFEVRHLANSAATLTNPRMFYDLVRPGIALYGLSPAPELGSGADFGLVPVMTLEADLVTVKTLPAGHGVSYAHQYRTAQRTVTAVVPLGYADGILRSASSGPDKRGGPVRVGDVLTEVAGRVCMDQFVIDLGPNSPAREGDTAVLFGDPTTGAPSAEDWARAAGTIGYEITTQLGARVPRIVQGQ